MTERLVKILIFDKMAASKQNVVFLWKNLHFIVAWKMKKMKWNCYQKSYFFNHYQTNISKKSLWKFQVGGRGHFGEMFLTGSENIISRKNV